METRTLPKCIADAVFNELYEQKGFEDWYHSLDHNKSIRLMDKLTYAVERELNVAGAVVTVSAASHRVMS